MESRHTSSQFMSGGERLHLQAWLPAGPDLEAPPAPTAVIAVVHGYGDHGGRYAWFGEDMAARGYAVYVYDLRGHGQSSGRRGQVKRFDDYLDDTAVFLDEVAAPAARHAAVLARPQPGRPHLRAVRRGARPGRPRPDPVVAVSAAGRGRTSGQSRGGEGDGQGVAQQGHRQHRAGGAADPRPVVAEAYVTDRWCTTWRRLAGPPRHSPRRTPRWPRRAHHAAAAGALRHRRSGGRRGVRRGPVRTRVVGDKSIERYQGYYHECFNETGREQVYQDLAAWLAARLTPAAG